MDLKGHSAGIYHFSFSADCTRFVSLRLIISASRIILKLHVSYFGVAMCLNHLPFASQKSRV